MALPTFERLMSNLYRMRREAVQYLEESKAEGDIEQVREWEKHVSNLNSMILKRGGKLDA